MTNFCIQSGKDSGRVPTNKGGSLPGKRKRGQDDAGGNGSACSSESQREGYRTSCAGARSQRLNAERAAFPASAGGRSRHVQRLKEEKVKDEGMKNIFIKKKLAQTARRHTRMGSSGNWPPRVGARRWLQHRAGAGATTNSRGVSGRGPGDHFVLREPTECQGDRRTRVVRAAEQPTSTKLQHVFGLAVIKRTAMQEPRQQRVIQKWTQAAE